MNIPAAGKLAASLMLGASLLLAGCSTDSSPADNPAPGIEGPVAEVAEAADWDPHKNPEYVPADDYISAISARYSTWAAGSSWRFSGDGWEPKAEVVVSVIRTSTADAAEAVIGEPVTVKADEFGQFADAYALPENVEVSDGYRLQAVTQADGRIESFPLSVARK